MPQINYTVIRNEMCPQTEVPIREGHNDRRSKAPLNADIVSERKEMNVFFHQNFTPDGQVESYQDTIDRLLAERKIVKHNFKPRSAIVDEFILDVNTDYFEQNGGYEFAKKFYAEAYRYAVKEAGSEDYIVSAVLHADERNKELSERYGHDIYHYHLHVVYVPVVQKEIKYTKRAGAELAGKVKEIIPQINHTDKWPRKKSGRGYFNEYSKLQDRYHKHMTDAGFTDLTRGERGSTAEHLDVLDFKIKKDTERLADVTAQLEQAGAQFDSLSAQVGRSEARLDTLSSQVEKKEARSEELNAQISVKINAKAAIEEIEKMGTARPVLGGFTVTNSEMKKLKALAKKGAGKDKRIKEKDDEINALKKEARDKDSEIADWKRSYNTAARERDTWKANYERLWGEVNEFIGVIRAVPNRLRAFIAEHLPQKNNREVTR